MILYNVHLAVASWYPAGVGVGILPKIYILAKMFEQINSLHAQRPLYKARQQTIITPRFSPKYNLTK